MSLPLILYPSKINTHQRELCWACSGGVMTKLARDAMPPDTHDSLTDKPELAAGFAVCTSPTFTGSLLGHDWAIMRSKQEKKR